VADRSQPPSDGLPPMPEPAAPAAFLPRLAAAAYDGLVLAGVLMLTSLVVIAARDGVAVPAGHPVYQAFLALQVGAYFIASWWRGGQTVGMRAWRIRVERADGGCLSPPAAAARLLVALASLAPLGAGFAWILVDAERRAWHDRLCGTRVVRLPRT
jgi:uncharacterized RDD family membrane protein YckC